MPTLVVGIVGGDPPFLSMYALYHTRPVPTPPPLSQHWEALSSAPPMPPIQDRLLPAVPTSLLLLGNHRRPHYQKVRRRKTPSIRVGGRRARRGTFLVRTFRKVRLRFLTLYYHRMLKRLGSFYHGRVRELAAARGAMNAAVQSYGAVALVPVTTLTTAYVW